MNQIKTNNGINGGLLKGKPHYDSNGNSLGGIKAIVTDSNNKPVELEGEEVIINKKSVKSKKVLTVKGTPKEILSTINQLDGNGVAIGEEAEILDKYKGGGSVGNKDPKTYEEIRAYAEKILKEFNPRYLGYSDANGQSMYFNVGSYEEPIKIRFSDHSVTNRDRMSNEIHFGLQNINSEYTKFNNEQKILQINQKLGDHSISYGKREMLMPSGKILQGFGYIKTMKTGGEIKNMTSSERKAFYNSPEGKRLDNETYNEWKELVNMSYSELKEFYNSPEGKKAGLSRSEAKEQGIDSGRTSARWILRMKQTPMSKWTSQMWIWAKKQISFIKRMSGVKGSLYNDKGKKTRKHTALLIWGHNPERKFNLGGAIDSSILINGYVSVQTLYIDHNIISEICLITYNSGGQSNLNVNDTMNATEMLKLFVDELDISKFDSMQIIYDHRFKSNRIASPEELDYYKNGFKTVIIDRDRIEFSNVNEKFRLGGEITKKALAVETTDLNDIVRKYFVNNGKMDIASAMQELFGNKKGKSISQEYRKRIGLHKAGAPTIQQLAHKLWESNKDELREGLDDTDFRNAIEEVITTEYGIKSMIEKLMNRSTESVLDKETEYWMNQYNSSQEEEPLNDTEIDEYFHDLEQFERETNKDTETNVVIDDLTIPKNVHEYLKEKYIAEAKSNYYDSKIKSLPRDNSGLISDETRHSNEYKKLKSNLDKSIIEERKLNSNKNNEISTFLNKLNILERQKILRYYKELTIGTIHELEHLETLEKVASKEITPAQAVVETAKTHIQENPEYYEDLSEMELEAKSLDELRELKKKLYSNVDIESPMTAHEKLLNKVIAGKFSKINEEIRNRQSNKSIIEQQIRGLELLLPMLDGEQKIIVEKQIRGLKLLINIV